MSYDIQLYRVETKQKETTANIEDFFDNGENLVPFSDAQFYELKERLLKYGYEQEQEDEFGLHFNNPDENYGTALLTNAALYFTAGWNENAIFEIGMTASEFTDSGEFAKYDPQNGGWEDF